MTDLALSTARATLHRVTEDARLRLVRATDRLARAYREWDEITAPQRAVLVVDDDAGLARFTASHLESSLGIEALVATSYDEAARLIPDVPWSCVVLDLALSDPQGRTGLALLRTIPRTVPVVICTGRLDDERLRTLATRARCAYYVKATPGVDLADVVRAAIAAHGETL